MRRMTLTLSITLSLLLQSPALASPVVSNNHGDNGIDASDGNGSSTAGGFGAGVAAPSDPGGVIPAPPACPIVLTNPAPILFPCAPTPGAPGPPPPTPTDLATTWSQSATLPDPALHVAPGYAVTGMTAYLEIHTGPWTTAIADPIRNDTITITCTPTTFDIDWGDNTPTDHTTSTGGPYPDGTVTHTYQQAQPAVTITTTEHWTCTWGDALGNGGTITDLRSTGRLTLEIREIQTTN